MIRCAVWLALLIVSLPVYAQRIEPPPSDPTHYLSIFTSSNWADNPQEKALIDSLRVEPMSLLKSRTNFKHYTPADPVYAAGRFSTITQDQFPVVIMGDANGGYFYKASRDTLPSDGRVLFEEMKEAYLRDKALKTPPVVPLNFINDDSPSYPQPDVNRDPVFPNAPWNIDSQVDQTLEGIFGGDTPVRDSLGYGVMLAVIALVCVFGFGLLVVGVVLFSLVVWAIRAFVK